MAKKWIQKAVSKMKKKGTVGAFGKATPSKIAHAKAEGGLQKKRAIFAENMSKISRSNKTMHFAEGLENIPEDRRQHYTNGTTAIANREKKMKDCSCSY